MTRSCDPSVVGDLGVPPQAATGHGNRGRVAQRAVSVRCGCRGPARVGDEHRPAVERPGDAGALEPVLVGRGPAVVEHDERVAGEHRGDPGTPGVPGAGGAAQHLAEVVPGEAVVTAEQTGRHPVLVAGEVERVAAQPHPPAVVVDEHDGVLDGELGAPRVDDGAAARGQRGRGVGVEGLDPPVLGTRCGTAEVEPPATRRVAGPWPVARGMPRRTSRARPAPRSRTAPRRRSAPPRPRPHGRRRRASQAVGEPDAAVVVEHRAGGPGPVARAAAGRRHDDLAVGARQRGAAHPTEANQPHRPMGPRAQPPASRRTAATASAVVVPSARARSR